MMLFAKKKMRYVTLSDSELRLAKYALIQFRNSPHCQGAAHRRYEHAPIEAIQVNKSTTLEIRCHFFFDFVKM